MMQKQFEEEALKLADELAEQKQVTPDAIEFYIREEPFGWLSNFERSPQTVDGVRYPTNEHYYHSMRANNKEAQIWVRTSPHPFFAMKCGRMLKDKNMEREDWPQVKLDVMLKGLRAKFSQNMELKKKLLATGKAVIREVPKGGYKDSFWGATPKGDGSPGESHLGRLLMQVREELRAAEQTGGGSEPMGVTIEPEERLGGHYRDG